MLKLIFIYTNNFQNKKLAGGSQWIATSLNGMKLQLVKYGDDKQWNGSQY